MRVLALDLSTSTGWALLEGKLNSPLQAKLIEYGTVKLAYPIAKYGAAYPWTFVHAARALGRMVLAVVEKTKYDYIVIEETNLGKQRYSQKALEFIHFCVLSELQGLGEMGKVQYVSSSEWRKTLNLALTAEDKRLNRKLSQAKSRAKAANKKLDKKALGIRGKFTKKHMALRFINSVFNLGLKVKDDDVADAICLGMSVFAGATTCNGE